MGGVVLLCVECCPESPAALNEPTVYSGGMLGSALIIFRRKERT